MQTTQLPFFAVIRATGSDAADFLHNQFSNDIKHLQANQACYATYNTPKGRVIANLIAQNTGNEILLALAADLVEAVVKRLKMYVLRAKVQFEILPDWGVAGSLKSNTPPQHPSEPQLSFPVNAQGEIQLPHTGSLKIAPRAELPAYDAAAEAAWQQHEIQSGYPWICAATSESCVAQMLNQHTIGGVHFKKGCYPGQEIIARAQYRGQVKRGLAVLSGSSLEAAGIAVLQDGAEAGIIINTACTAEGSLSLAVIKHSAAAAPLTDADGNPLQQQQLFFDTAEAE